MDAAAAAATTLAESEANNTLATADVVGAGNATVTGITAVVLARPTASTR